MKTSMRTLAALMIAVFLTGNLFAQDPKPKKEKEKKEKTKDKKEKKEKKGKKKDK
jgi:hypothetical protein